MSEIPTDNDSIMSDNDSMISLDDSDSFESVNSNIDNNTITTQPNNTETGSKIGGSIIQLDTDIESMYHNSEQNEIRNYKYDIVNINTTYNNLSKQKLTRNILTKFEKTLLLGIRAQQLINGAQPMIDASNFVDIKEIVREELRQKKIPLLIRRYLPNNSYEDWSLHELHYSI